MNLFVHGYNLDQEGDPFVIVGTLQEVQLSVPLSRNSVEDLEAAVFLDVLIRNWHSEARAWVEPNGDDPPDFFLYREGQRWGLELTKLTIHDVRVEIARARRFAASLQERANNDLATYGHLQGRVINLYLTKDPLPAGAKALNTLLEAVMERLRTDEGVMLPVQLEPDGSMPQQLAPDGFYGDIGPVNITQADAAVPGAHVVPHVQAQVFASETTALLNKIVQSKDVAGNDVLAIAAGLPDQSGFACVVDSGLVDLIRRGLEAGQALELHPMYLKLIVLHAPLVPPLVLYHDEQAFPLP